MGREDERGAEPGESPKERADRELIELLNELRVVLPGVTVLFGFLLAVPFARGWPRVTPFERDTFLAAFFATALSALLLMAPSSYHRLRFRHGNKERIVRLGNALAIAGLFAFAIALGAVVLLVADYLLSRTAAVAATAVVMVVLLALWYGLPLYGRLEDR